VREVVDPAFVFDENSDECFRHGSEFRGTHFTHVVHQFVPPVHLHVHRFLHDHILVGCSLVTAFVRNTDFDTRDVIRQISDLLVGVFDVIRQYFLLVFEHLDTMS